MNGPLAGQDCYRSSRVLLACRVPQIIVGNGDSSKQLRDVSRRCYVGFGRVCGLRSETMASTGLMTGAWHLETESEKQLVRSQLERIVSDSRFAASKRYPQLLRYIVEQTLEGNEYDLKERTLGVEVFHRPPDYDTNLDPVVRLCAAEVRKRLAQYYQSREHGGELRIELNPGSYIPVFSPPTPDAPAHEMIPAEVPSKTEPVSKPKRTRKIHWPAGLIASGVIVVAILVLGTRYWKQFGKPKPSLEKQESALAEVWSPLLTSNKPVLFCVGETEFELFATNASPLTALQSGADDDSNLHVSTEKNDFVPFSDVQVLSRFVSLFGAYGHAFRVQSSRKTVSSQLREGPVVLIGALNNDWTLNRTSSLRFHLVGPEGPNRIYWIGDAQHPESRAWQVSALAPRSKVVKDYAIAARFTDEATGQVVLVAAGIAGSGTRAAGEFLTNDANLKQLADDAGADWAKKNFEVVLSSQVVNGMQGKPTVEAKAFW
jgi:hypothetical protein